MIFQENFLVLDDNTVLAIKFIESIRYPDMEDALVDVLKNDLHLEVVTISGNKYTISVEKQNRFGEFYSSDLLRDEICQKWKFIMTH